MAKREPSGLYCIHNNQVLDMYTVLLEGNLTLETESLTLGEQMVWASTLECNGILKYLKDFKKGADY